MAGLNVPPYYGRPEAWQHRDELGRNTSHYTAQHGVQAGDTAPPLPMPLSLPLRAAYEAAAAPKAAAGGRMNNSVSFIGQRTTAHSNSPDHIVLQTQSSLPRQQLSRGKKWRLSMQLSRAASRRWQESN